MSAESNVADTFGNSDVLNVTECWRCSNFVQIMAFFSLAIFKPVLNQDSWVILG